MDGTMQLCFNDCTVHSDSLWGSSTQHTLHHMANYAAWSHLQQHVTEISTYVCTHMHAYTYMCMHTNTCTHTQICMHTNTQMCIHALQHTATPNLRSWIFNGFTQVYTFLSDKCVLRSSGHCLIETL